VRSTGYQGKPLSDGQLAALRLAASGYTSRQIAARLDTTEQAVHLRLKEAQVRLGARSRTHAVVIALRRHVISFDDLDLDQPGHDTGPSVREAAADDRAHWTTRQWNGET
jgi:DNA-binding CsgD family transcriptional regulator